MKLKAKQEIKNKDIKELKDMLADKRKEFTQTKLDHAQFKVKNTSQLTNLRKEIAVIQTIMKEKEMSNGKNA